MIKLTSEQQAVHDAAVDPKGPSVISVNALPGSGKTQMLEAIGNDLSDQGLKSIYLVFNGHNAEEAQNRLTGENISIMSFHRLAYSATFGDRNRQPDKNQTPTKPIATTDLEKLGILDHYEKSLIPDAEASKAIIQARLDAERTGDAQTSFDDYVAEVSESSSAFQSEIEDAFLNFRTIAVLAEDCGVSAIVKDLPSENIFFGDARSSDPLLVGLYSNWAIKQTKLAKTIDTTTLFKKSCLQIVEEALENGNTTIEAKYYSRKAAWLSAKKHLLSMFNRDLDSFGPTADAINPKLDKAIEQYLAGAMTHQLDLTNDCPMLHSGYLANYGNSNKPFQLGRQYDYILLDEAQDTNPACWHIIQAMMNGNSKLRMVLVGDQHQSIYSFRKAKNVLSETPSKRIDQSDPDHFRQFALTTVFRVGGEVVDVANALLRLRHHHLAAMSRAKMYSDPLTNDSSILSNPLYMCNAQDTERGKIVSSLQYKPVIEAFKDAAGTTPCVISANNSGLGGGVLYEAGTNLLAGRAITLPTGGSAHGVLRRLALLSRYARGSLEGLSEDDAAIHTLAINKAFEAVCLTTHQSPGFLLSKQQLELKNIVESTANHFGSFIEPELLGESISQHFVPKSDRPTPDDNRSIVGIVMAERVALSYMTDEYDEHVFGIEPLLASVLADAADLLPNSEMSAGQLRHVNAQLTALTQEYAHIMCMLSLRGQQLHKPNRYLNTGELAAVVDQFMKAPIEILQTEHGFTREEAVKACEGRTRVCESLRMHLRTPSVKHRHENASRQAKGIASPLYVAALESTVLKPQARAAMFDNLSKYATSIQLASQFLKEGSREAGDRLLMGGDTVVGSRRISDLESHRSVALRDSALPLLAYAIADQYSNDGELGQEADEFALDRRIVLKDLQLTNAVEPDVILGTVHKTKGLEYDYVGLSKDISSHVQQRKPQEQAAERWNAALIASTRARLGLVLNESLEADILTLVGRSPVASKLAGDAAEALLASLANMGGVKAEFLKSLPSFSPDTEENLKETVAPVVDALHELSQIINDGELLSTFLSGDEVIGHIAHITKVMGFDVVPWAKAPNTVEASANLSKTVYLLNQAQLNINNSASAFLGSYLLESLDQKKMNVRLSTLDLEGASLRDVESAKSQIASLKYGSTEMRSMAVYYSLSTASLNEPLNSLLCPPKVDDLSLSAINKHITKALTKGDLLPPSPGMSTNEAATIYSEMALSMASVAAKCRMQHREEAPAPTKTDAFRVWSGNSVSPAVTDFYKQNVVAAHKALCEHDFDYKAAFPDQVIATTKDPESLYMLDDATRTKQLSNETAVKKREKEVTRKLYGSDSDVNKKPAHKTKR